MSLKDDIARVAALRGRSAADYADPNRFRPRLTPAAAVQVFRMGMDGVADALAFDRLPEASRTFLRECPQPINARLWEGLLATFAESDIIAAVRSLVTWPSTSPRYPLSRRRR